MKSPTDTPHFLGLRTAIYYAPDLAKAKSWYLRIPGLEPYCEIGDQLLDLILIRKHGQCRRLLGCRQCRCGVETSALDRRS